MKYQFGRNRSEFWITVYENEDCYSISTNERYIDIINYAFPNLVANSPTKWKKSEKYNNMSNLWIPEGCYTQEVMNDFLEWCNEVTQNVLWIHLNKNIEDYFYDELDYCIASDFNIVYGEGRTEIGEAEYQLKYNIDNLSEKEQTQYADLIMHRMLDNCKYIPIYNTLDWCISPMPASNEGKTKMAWQMAEAMSRQLNFSFIAPTLNCDKPQMKQLTVEDKIAIWKEIYDNNNVVLNSHVRGKNIIVVDDLYQSGATIWEYAKYLKKMGAKQVCGIVCVKSLRDSDNT